MSRKMVSWFSVAIFFSLVVQANAQWVHLNAPTNGWGPGITCFAAIGSNLFAGSQGGGVFLSTDNGDNWTSINNGLTSLNVRSLATIGNQIFVGCATSSTGVFASSDTGKNWVSTGNTGLGGAMVFALVSYDIGLLVGTDQGVFYSTDGSNWAPQNNGLTFRQVRCFSENSERTLIGTGGGGVFHSKPTGILSWYNFNNGLTSPTLVINSLATNGSDSWAGTNDAGVFQCLHGDSTWTAVNVGLVNKSISALLNVGNRILAGTLWGIYQSTNLGTSWSPFNEGLSEASVIDMKTSALFAFNNYLFAGLSTGQMGGILRRPISELKAQQRFHQEASPNNVLKLSDISQETIQVGFNLIMPCYVTLTITDMNGRLVTSLVNEPRPTGSYQIAYNCSRLSAGSYTVHLFKGADHYATLFPILH